MVAAPAARGDLAAAQLLACASAKRQNVARLWWKLAEIEMPPLAVDSAREIAQTYLGFI